MSITTTALAFKLVTCAALDPYRRSLAHLVDDLTAGDALMSDDALAEVLDAWTTKLRDLDRRRIDKVKAAKAAGE